MRPKREGKEGISLARLKEIAALASASSKSTSAGPADISKGRRAASNEVTVTIRSTSIHAGSSGSRNATSSVVSDTRKKLLPPSSSPTTMRMSKAISKPEAFPDSDEEHDLNDYVDEYEEDDDGMELDEEFVAELEGGQPAINSDDENDEGIEETREKAYMRSAGIRDGFDSEDYEAYDAIGGAHGKDDDAGSVNGVFEKGISTGHRKLSCSSASSSSGSTAFIAEEADGRTLNSVSDDHLVDGEEAYELEEDELPQRPHTGMTLVCEPIIPKSISLESSASNASTQSQSGVARPKELTVQNVPRNNGKEADGGGTITDVDDLASVLKEWADDFDKVIEGFFSKNKLFDLLGLWMMILILDASFASPTRIEWLGFCVLSLSPFQRTLRTSLKAVLSLTLFYLVSDLLLFLIMKSIALPRLLPTVANMIVYGHVIGCIRGLDPMSWGLWGSLIAVDVFAKDPPVGEVESLPAVHCISYGFYLFMSEVLTVLMEYRNERLASNDLVNGELRIYPSSLMANSYPNAGRVVGGAVATGRTTMYEGAAGLVRCGGAEAGDRNLTTEPTSPSSSTSSSDTAIYYYSNHYDTANRFELCVDSITKDSVSLSWSLPQSLIVTLCSYAEVHPPPGMNGAAHNTVRPPPPVVAPISLPNGVNRTTLPQQNAGGPRGPAVEVVPVASGGSLVLPPVPPLTASTTLTARDVVVTVDGVEWSGSKVSASMPQGTVCITGLQPDKDCEIILWIRGYGSTPVWICPSRKSGELSGFLLNATIFTVVLGGTELRVSRVTKRTPDQVAAGPVMQQQQQHQQPQQIAAPAPTILSSLEIKRAKLLSLQSQLEGSLEERKLSHAMLKKLRRDFARTLAHLRSEIDTLKRLMAKDASIEAKSRQRVHSLMELIKQGDSTLVVLGSELADLEGRRATFEGELQGVRHEWGGLKEGLKKLEKALGKTVGSVGKLVAGLEGEIKGMMKDVETWKAELDRCKEELRRTQAEAFAISVACIGGNGSGNAAAVGSVKASGGSGGGGAAANVEKNKKRREEAEEVETLEKDVAVVRAACEGARDRNWEVRRTVEDEVRFKHKLQEELRRVEECCLRREAVAAAAASAGDSQVSGGWLGVGRGFGGIPHAAWEDGLGLGFRHLGNPLEERTPLRSYSHPPGHPGLLMSPTSGQGDVAATRASALLDSFADDFLLRGAAISQSAAKINRTINSALDLDGLLPLDAPPSTMLLATAAEEVKRVLSSPPTTESSVENEVDRAWVPLVKGE
ncbi:hypothetical protein HK101_009257 [Irineochytrium annulatum]|nr:hypothetical protein HK101_009257 [Irineochytrium annulatum]